MHWSSLIALAPKQSRYSVPAEHFRIRRQNSPNKWTSCSRCWLTPTRSSKQPWARWIFASSPPNALWVDCSSVNPSFSRKMAAEAARGQIHFVDAPVTGSAPAAAEAKLIFWVGADPADLERIRPYCCAWATKLFIRVGMALGPP